MLFFSVTQHLKNTDIIQYVINETRHDHTTVSGFVNNVTDDIGVLQVLRSGEEEHFRQSAGTTLPRLMGLELTFSMN